MRIAILALPIFLALASPAWAGDVDIEGYHDRGDRIACVMVKRASGATAVRCGARGRSKGLLLGSSGRARRVRWEWRTDRPDIDHFTVKYGQTLYLYGGTAKLEGDSKTLRCTFLRSPSVRVRCRNRAHEIVVTRTRLIRR
jgi:hypothetical protein